MKITIADFIEHLKGYEPNKVLFFDDNDVMFNTDVELGENEEVVTLQDAYSDLAQALSERDE